MDFECSFAGVPFRLPTPEVLAYFERYDFLANLRATLPLGQVWPGPKLTQLGAAVPFNYPPLKLGEYFYPCGASRFSIFHGLMTSDDLAAVNAAVTFGDFGIFRMTNTTADAPSGLSTPLWMLPPVVVSQPAGQPTLYLITLVDERFWWHQWATVLADITPTNNATWTSLITEIYQALVNAGATCTFETPDSVYGVPDPDSALYSWYESGAALFDAVAADVGCVVVRNFDANYQLQKYADAAAAVQANRPASGNNVLGGDTQPVIVPAAVCVTFPGWLADTGYFEPFDYRDHAMDSYGAVYPYVIDTPSQFLSYPTLLNSVEEKCLRVTGKAIWATLDDITNPPSNDAALSALATQLATDYYTRLVARLDETYAGIYSWTPEGISDVLYCWRADNCYTRVMPPPFNAANSEFQNATATPVIPFQTGSNAIGDTFQRGKLVSFGGLLIPSWVAPPAGISASGVKGQLAIDSNYLYVCTATNVWVEIPLTTGGYAPSWSSNWSAPPPTTTAAALDRLALWIANNFPLATPP